jgi:hypothetical protein
MTITQFDGSHDNCPVDYPHEHEDWKANGAAVCKVEDCTNRAGWKSGMYAGLCSEHAAEKKGRKTPRKTPAADTPPLVSLARDIHEQLQVVEREKTKLAELVQRFTEAIG